MDKDILLLIERAVSEGIRSHLWVLLIGLGIPSAVGAFVGTALKKSGEMFAARIQFDRLSKEIVQQTQATESIKAELQKSVNQATESIKAELQKSVNKDNERFKAEFTTYNELWGLLTDFRRLGKVVEMKQRDDETSDDLLKTYEHSAEALLECLEKNRPFYAEEIRHELLELHSDIACVIERSKSLPPKFVSQFAGGQTRGYTPEGAKAVIELNKALKRLDPQRLESICKMIRERVGFA